MSTFILLQELPKGAWEKLADRGTEALIIFLLLVFLYKGVWPFFKGVIEKLQTQIDTQATARETALKEFMTALERRDALHRDMIKQQEKAAENQKELTHVVEGLVNKIEGRK